MSVQNAVTFIQKLAEDSKLAASLESKADAVRLGNDMGLTFSEAELDQAIAENTSELSTDELQNIAGGRFKPL